jgi:sigma-E factor negative regulatory protein RseA
MNEELDSQLSAMFDDELPAAECELLARRLSRDEQLKARWGRYAVIGATIRAERGVRLNAALASRVSAAISSEPALAAEPAPQPKKRWENRSWWQPVASVAAVAGVAAVSILWMRSQVSTTEQPPLMAQAQALPTAVNPNTKVDLTPVSASQISAGPSYTVPKMPDHRRLVFPSTELANYVVAHSEFSSPVTRRNLLSAFMASESGTAGTSAVSEEPTEDVHDDAKSPQ